MSTPTPVTPDSRYGDIVARLSAVQKSNKGAAGYTRWVNRRLGRYLAAAGYKAGLTPNQVTILSGGLTFTALALIAALRATFVTGLIVTILLVAGYALDAADGQLARLRGGGSAVGEWLDHVLDAVKCVSIHLVVLISWYRFFDLGNAGWLLVPLGFAVQSSVFFFAIILSEQLRRTGQGVVSSTLPKTSEPAPVLRSLIVLPNDYGLLCLTFLLLGAHSTFRWIYTALMAINVVFLLVGCVRWYREMKTIGHAEAAPGTTTAPAPAQG